MEEVDRSLACFIEDNATKAALEIKPTLSIDKVPVWKYSAYCVENGDSIVTNYEGAEINIKFIGGVLSVNGYDYRGITMCYLMRDRSGKFQMIKVVTESNSHMFVKMVG